MTIHKLNDDKLKEEEEACQTEVLWNIGPGVKFGLISIASKPLGSATKMEVL